MRALERRPEYKLEGKTSSLRVVLSAVRVVLSGCLPTAFSQGPDDDGMVGIMVNIVAYVMTRLVMKKKRTGTGGEEEDEDDAEDEEGMSKERSGSCHPRELFLL